MYSIPEDIKSDVELADVEKLVGKDRHVGL